MASPFQQQQQQDVLVPTQGGRNLYGASSHAGNSGTGGGLAPAAMAAPPAVHVRSSYSFTTGIIIGQASVFLLLFLVVRYVVFEDGKAGMKRRAERARAAGERQVRRLRVATSGSRQLVLQADRL
jgi:hypothetical protein